MTYQQQAAFENIVGKKEIARNEQFIPFPTMFSTSSDCADPKSDCGVQSDLDLHCPKNIIMTYQQQAAFENIVGKKEIARNEQFLFSPQCFLIHR